MKKIYRSKEDRKIAGICGGLGEILSIDPTIIRLIVIFLCVITGGFPIIITYLVGWWLVPEKP